MLVKDAYFNLVEPNDLGLSKDFEDEFLVEIIKDKNISLKDNIEKVNTLLPELGFKKIKRVQEQRSKFKAYIKYLYLSKFGYKVTDETVEKFGKILTNLNIDWYFLSKYLGVNNMDEFSHYLKQMTKNLKELDLLASAEFMH